MSKSYKYRCLKAVKKLIKEYFTNSHDAQTYKCSLCRIYHPIYSKIKTKDYNCHGCPNTAFDVRREEHEISMCCYFRSIGIYSSISQEKAIQHIHGVFWEEAYDILKKLPNEAFCPSISSSAYFKELIDIDKKVYPNLRQ